MNRNLLSSLLLLTAIAPLAAADVLPLPPPPAPLPTWTPTDAVGYGVGGGTLTMDNCDGLYTLAIAVFDETQTNGDWSTTFEYHLDPASTAEALAVGNSCG